ncbi:hypothetical protein IWZ01DRAFT_325013 [Phyllosticta capitalensis]
MQTHDIREFLTGSQDFNVLTASRKISSLSLQHDTPCFSLARCQTGSALKKRGKKQEESNQLLVLRQSSRCRSSPSPYGTALTGARTCLRPTTTTTKKNCKTYNSRDSLLVTHATTNRPQGSLSMEERTGFRVFYLLWSYMNEVGGKLVYVLPLH